MKGKLIKVEDGYNLFIEQPQGRLLEATCSISEIKRLEKNNVSFKKLSIKNCESIENGYDLDELYEKVENSDFSDKYEDSVHYYSFIEGAKTILELLGDKRFSESDMIHAYIEGTNDGAQFESMMDYDNSDNSEAEDFSKRAEQDFRKLLQPTEWDCIIFVDEKTNQPLLDNEGNLILKRK